MAKDFQKPATTVSELHLPHPGIMDARAFDAHFALHCYEPSPALRPFVVHIWVQRLRRPPRPAAKPPVEIASGPNAYAFFTPNAAFIQPAKQGQFAYDPFAAGVIAGIKFQPGGLYPFARRSLAELDVEMPSIASIFPEVNETFTKDLLTRSDAEIVRIIERLLLGSHPQNSKNLQLIAQIMHALANDGSLRTVAATAKAFDMSERSLQLLFQTHVGVGVKWIINRMRLLEAIARVKKQPHITWVEVAAELGYSSQSHFSREFKEVTGLAPSEYGRGLKAGF